MGSPARCQRRRRFRSELIHCAAPKKSGMAPRTARIVSICCSLSKLPYALANRSATRSPVLSVYLLLFALIPNAMMGVERGKRKKSHADRIAHGPMDAGTTTRLVGWDPVGTPPILPDPLGCVDCVLTCLPRAILRSAHAPKRKATPRTGGQTRVLRLPIRGTPVEPRINLEQC